MYEWDERKRAINRAKHGIDFAEVQRFEWATADTRVDEDRLDEPRFVSLGFVGGRLHAVVWTARGSRTRIISMRRATASERRRYAQGS
jgi:hypothetical protein